MASLSISPRPSGFRFRLAGIEEHFRLEHEAVADDADVRPVAEDLRLSRPKKSER